MGALPQEVGKVLGPHRIAIAVKDSGDVHEAAAVCAEQTFCAGGADIRHLVLHHRSGKLRMLDRKGAAEAAALVLAFQFNQLDVAELPQQFGEKLAALHSVDPAWFDSWREKLCEHHPYLKTAPHGSHVWWFANRADEWLAGKADEWKEAYCAPIFKPQSPAG